MFSKPRIGVASSFLEYTLLYPFFLFFFKESQDLLKWQVRRCFDFSSSPPSQFLRNMKDFLCSNTNIYSFPLMSSVFTTLQHKIAYKLQRNSVLSHLYSYLQILTISPSLNVEFKTEQDCKITSSWASYFTDEETSFRVTCPRSQALWTELWVLFDCQLNILLIWHIFIS